LPMTLVLVFAVLWLWLHAAFGAVALSPRYVSATADPAAGSCTLSQPCVLRVAVSGSNGDGADVVVLPGFYTVGSNASLGFTNAPFSITRGFTISAYHPGGTAFSEQPVFNLTSMERPNFFDCGSCVGVPGSVPFVVDGLVFESQNTAGHSVFSLSSMPVTVSCPVEVRRTTFRGSSQQLIVSSGVAVQRLALSQCTFESNVGSSQGLIRVTGSAALQVLLLFSRHCRRHVPRRRRLHRGAADGLSRPPGVGLHVSRQPASQRCECMHPRAGQSAGKFRVQRDALDVFDQLCERLRRCHLCRVSPRHGGHRLLVRVEQCGFLESPGGRRSATGRLQGHVRLWLVHIQRQRGNARASAGSAADTRMAAQGDPVCVLIFVSR
jgi:hypothetical protein